MVYVKGIVPWNKGKRKVVPILIMKEIIKDYESGLPQRKIFLKYKISQGCFSSILDKYKIKKRNNIESARLFYISLNEPKIKEIVRDYLLGISINKIQKKYHCHYFTIKNILKNNNIKLKNQQESCGSGKNRAQWRGGRIISCGYRYIYYPNHPHNATSWRRKYVAEHRLVMEKKLKRFLTPEEVIHHKDGDTLNNKISNLELTNSSNHRRIHNNLRYLKKTKKSIILSSY